MMQHVVCLCSTCGLAEELEQESREKQKADLPKSACGSVSITCQVATRFVFSSIVATCFFSVCGSVILAMPFDVPAVHTWGCQLSNQERRLY